MADTNSTSQVEYQQINQFLGYRFGSDGSVWSQRNRHKTTGWRRLSLTPDWTGYLHVCLCSGPGRILTRNVHRLILEAFRGPCPTGMECRHLNGNRADNRIENLEWGTKEDNASDRVAHGTMSRGESHGLAKLTEDRVRTIRKLAEQGIKNSQIARQFQVSQGTIGNVVRRKIWTHI